jgi:hypothetical protein
MIRYDVMVRIQIDARDPAEAFMHARAIESLVKHPFVKGQIENEGVRVAGDIIVFMPQEQRNT